MYNNFHALSSKSLPKGITGKEFSRKERKGKEDAKSQSDKAAKKKRLGE